VLYASLQPFLFDCTTQQNIEIDPDLIAVYGILPGNGMGPLLIMQHVPYEKYTLEVCTGMGF